MLARVSHPLAPALAVLAAGIAWLVAAPMTADLAAHTYRLGVWERSGFVVWDLGWYGGHHEPGYSLLYAPLAELVGIRPLGVLAGALTVVVAARLAGGLQSRGAVLAAWLFAGAVATDVLIGRVPFALGVLGAVAAWVAAERAALRRGRAWLAAAAALALAGVWASPPAGLFLAVAGAARVLAGGRRELGPAAALVVPAVLGGLGVYLLFPEGGRDHFAPAAFWPTLGLGLAALALLDPGCRRLRATGALFLLVLVAAYVLPVSVGQTALRPVVLLGPTVLALGLRRGRPALVAALLVGAGLLYLQWLPVVRAIGEPSGDPSTRAAFHAEVLDVVEGRRAGERLEVPLTKNHWEAAHLAPHVPLARGWHRQLDTEANPLFYDDRPLTPARYAAWLRDKAVRWVALPAVPLDFSAREEAALLRRGAVPGLALIHASPRWRIWEVRPAPAAVEGPARLVRAQGDTLELDAARPGRVRVRVRHTPYWEVVGGEACVARAAGGWTEVRVRRAGRVVARARFTLAGALRRAGC
jgi:hypothetical protein